MFFTNGWKTNGASLLGGGMGRGPPLTLFQDYVLPFLIFYPTPQRPGSRQTRDWILYLEPSGMTSNFTRSLKEGNLVPAADGKKEGAYAAVGDTHRFLSRCRTAFPSAARGRGQNQPVNYGRDDESLCVTHKSELRTAERGLRTSCKWQPRARGFIQAANNLNEKDHCRMLVIRLRPGAERSERRQRPQI